MQEPLVKRKEILSRDAATLLIQILKANRIDPLFGLRWIISMSIDVKRDEDPIRICVIGNDAHRAKCIDCL